MREDDAQDRTIYRVGATTAIVGSLAAMVGNLLHPASPINDPAGVAHTVAHSHGWHAIHFIILFGLVLMLPALLALRHSIRDGIAGGLSRFGLVMGIAGITIGLVFVVLDTVAAKLIADQWAAAPAGEQATALRIVMAYDAINVALASLFYITFAGFPFIFFGLAVALSDAYPRWLGWIAVVAGVGSIGAGLIQAVAGETTPATHLLSIISPTVITLWLIAIGILLARRAARMKDPA